MKVKGGVVKDIECQKDIALADSQLVWSGWNTTHAVSLLNDL